MFESQAAEEGGSFQRSVRRGAELFNAGLFWHCHEVLEEVWLEAEGQRKDFLQGVIWAAAGLHKWAYERNYRGMVIHLTRALEKLEPMAPERYELDLASFTAGLRDCLEQVESLGPARIDEFDASDVPQLFRVVRPD